MPGPWNGFHYDGRTANREPVTVVATAAGLHLARADGGTAVWPYAQLRRTAGVSASRVRLEHGRDPVEALVIDGTDILAVIGDASPETAARLRAARAPGLPSSHALRWSMIGVAALAVGYVWGVPAFAAWVAPRVPASWERQLGMAAVDRMAPTPLRCDDPAQAVAIRGIVDRLLATTPDTRMEFTVTIANDSMVNAFAAPGGQLVIFTGLLKAAASAEELAGVLAHEMQHAIHHHPTRALAREIPIRIALAAMGGGNDGAGTAVQMAGTLGVLRYRRGDELEADRDGMRMIQAARVDPNGMVSFMRGLGRRHRGMPQFVSYLSTHPNNSERVAMLEQLALDARYNPLPLMPAAAWARTREACKDA